jgi:hypothetical protein
MCFRLHWAAACLICELCLLAWCVSFNLLVSGVLMAGACFARASIFLREGQEPGYTQRWITAVVTVNCSDSLM